MSGLAFVDIKAACPRSETVQDKFIAFQWGYCEGRQPYSSSAHYKIGDHIRWRKLRNGIIPMWANFRKRRANIGDPAIVNLIVTDAGLWSWNYCPNCAFPIGGGAVRIENGTITKAWLYAEGEFNGDTDIYLIEPDGTLTPKPEWFDHCMQFLNDDGTPNPRRFLT